MKALLYKDWINGKSTLKVLLSILLLLGTLMFFRVRDGKDTFSILPWFAVLLISLGQISLNNDSFYKLQYHIHAMPFSRQQAVCSKFIPAIVVTALIFPIFALFGFFALPDYRYLTPLILISGVFIGVFQAFYFLIHYFSRGKKTFLFGLGLYAVLIVVVKIFNSHADFSVAHNIVEGMIAQPILWGIGVLAVIVVAFAVSIRLCIRRFERQDIY